MRRPVVALIAVALFSTLAACGSGPATSAPPTPGAMPSETPAATPVPATPSATASPEPTPAPTPATFESPAYRYAAAFPPGLLTSEPAAATEPWDGVAQIDSTGARTDHFSLIDSRLLFAYGAPTDLGLADYAVAGQALKADWHGCPATPDRQDAATFGGSPALLYDFTCGGLHILSLYTVRDGFGLVVNLMSPPGDPESDRSLFADWLASWSWQP